MYSAFAAWGYFKQPLSPSPLVRLVAGDESICLSDHLNKFRSSFEPCAEQTPETMAPRKGLRTDEISNLLRELPENESDGVKKLLDQVICSGGILQLNFESDVFNRLSRFIFRYGPNYCNDLVQGRSSRRINDTGPPSYRSPNMCNYSPTNRAPLSKKGPEGILIQSLLRASYANVFANKL
ncbi:hypothetical protein TNCV_3102111 [Trichonephila clavipes]|nr:hypothetical protein TNCV_3102111 [Trichonephila clavipes]